MQLFTFKNLYFYISLSALFVTIIFLPQFVNGQSNEKNIRQQKSEVLRLIEKAEQSHRYRVRHIFFSGNVEISDRVFRGKFNKFLNEGDVFSRQNLYNGLKNLNKLKVINAVRLEDVEVSLNEREKEIELTITIREKPHSN